MGQKPPSEIAAKRRASRIPNIQRKVDEGTATGLERGFVRVSRTTTRILTGQEDLSLWDDEELRRGQKRDKNGNWQGVQSKIIPKAIHDELVRRTLSQAEQLLRDNLAEAIEMLVDVMRGKDTEDKDKLKAIEMIMNRVMGKEPLKVDLTVGTKKPWEEAMDAVIVPTDDDVVDVIDTTAVEIDEDDPFGLGDN
jgi:hypothetical protein